VLTGKVLRITPSGGIPADNPFHGLGTARCNLSGRTNPGMRCQETFAWGLRNPFRIAFDPNAAGTRFYIDDVGQSTWEEIDEGAAGADYGWNVREGHCANGSTTSCGAPPAGMTNPVFDYGRSDGCGSITGGAFVPAGVWPAPHGSGRALYYTTDAGGGAVRRIVYTGSSNRAPRTTHRYVQAGTYTAQLTVRDNHANLSAPDTVRIDAGNTPPKPTITSPASGRNCDVLPVTGPRYGWVCNSSVEVQLTATDSRGATATVTRIMSPKLVNLTFVTRPVGGLGLTLNGTAFSSPRAWTSWRGWNITVNAPDSAAYAFGSWSDGGARSHAIVTPSSARTYTATYRRITP
jgi:hypothetical protein